MGGEEGEEGSEFAVSEEGEGEGEVGGGKESEFEGRESRGEESGGEKLKRVTFIERRGGGGDVNDGGVKELSHIHVVAASTGFGAAEGRGGKQVRTRWRRRSGAGKPGSDVGLLTTLPETGLIQDDGSGVSGGEESGGDDDESGESESGTSDEADDVSLISIRFHLISSLISLIILLPSLYMYASILPSLHPSILSCLALISTLS